MYTYSFDTPKVSRWDVEDTPMVEDEVDDLDLLLAALEVDTIEMELNESF